MRFANWEERLNAVIEHHQASPFRWGKADCCLFAADCMMEMTGIDWAEDVRGTYSNAEEAKFVLEEMYDITSVSDIPDAMGFEEIPLTMAMRGDLVAYESEYGPALGICYGRVGLFKSRRGLQAVPMSNVMKAWKVK